ncbi:hypothetical protein BDR22DRAFT_907256 [Usnea florida]
MPPPPPPPQQQPPPAHPLPTSRALLTTLLHTFSTLPSTTTNPSTPLTAPTKPLLLTLHALFPTTLLPALDLLDRHFITKLIYNPNTTPAAVGARETIPDKETVEEGKRVVYHVKSAAPQRARYVGGGAMCYEVRTRGWSCSCAAFAFASAGGGGEGWAYEGFGGGGDGLDEMLLDREEGGEGVEELGGEGWGGLMARGDVPLCKHLFACVIAENWHVAGEMVEERVVGREEMAGWAAGWGG